MKLPPAEFFDIFGALAFLYITGFSLWALFAPASLPRWALIILLLVGIAGFIIDAVIVYKNYLK
ncbi:MAG TPA: hypothetical protein VJL09_01660 [Candidatus Paceibacterota bacterium]